MVTETTSRADMWDRFARIADPEIPVLTLADLGVLRSVDEGEAGLVVTITPTYSGCPAVGHMADRIRAEGAAAGRHVEVVVAHTPAWTTDWMSDEARRKLADHGIAPPTVRGVPTEVPVRLDPLVRCPRCGSASETISRFSSTACKALMRCLGCREPFEYFKEH